MKFSKGKSNLKEISREQNNADSVLSGPFKNDELNTRFTEAVKKSHEYFGKDIVDEALRAFNIFYRIEGFSVTVETDFGRRATIASVKNNDELFFVVIKEIFSMCSDKYEFKNRETNAKNWRYLRARVENGCWLYSENKNYKYNAIEDTRKVCFESHIASLALVFSSDMLLPVIKEYSALMNLWFSDIHWQFDEGSLQFVEISSSRSRDADGREHPMQNEILG